MSRSKSKTLEDMIRKYASGTDNPRHQQVQINLSALSEQSKQRQLEKILRHGENYSSGPLIGSRPGKIIFDDIVEVPEVVKYKSPKETWDRSTQAMGQFNAVPVDWNMWTGKWLRELELRVENHIDGIPNSFSFKHIKFL